MRDFSPKDIVELLRGIGIDGENLNRLIEALRVFQIGTEQVQQILEEHPEPREHLERISAGLSIFDKGLGAVLDEKELQIENPKTYNFKELMFYENLERLVFWGEWYETTDLSELAHLDHLKSLIIKHTNGTFLDIGSIEKHCKHLERLYIEIGCAHIDTRVLSGLSDLSFLFLVSSEASSFDATGLTELRSLEELILGLPAVDTLDLTYLNELLSIRHLRVQGVATCLLPQRCPVSTLFIESEYFSDLTPLHDYPMLEELALKSPEMNYRKRLQEGREQNLDLSHLKDNDKLTTLTIDHISDRHQEPHDMDLRPLSQCASLKKIHITHNKLKSLYLPSSPTLATMNARNNELRTVDLSPLRACNRLGFIDLGINKLKRIDLSPLENISIAAIDLSYNRFKTINLPKLQSLSELRITDNPISELDITPLLEIIIERIDKGVGYKMELYYEEDLKLTAESRLKERVKSVKPEIWRRFSRVPVERITWN